MLVTWDASDFVSQSIQTGVVASFFEARWQLVSDELDPDGSVTYDTGYQTLYMDTFTYNIATTTQRWARMKMRDNYGIISDWSNLVLALVTQAPPVGNEGRRRIIFGEVDVASDGLTISASPKRQIIFGEVV